MKTMIAEPFQVVEVPWNPNNNRASKDLHHSEKGKLPDLMAADSSSNRSLVSLTNLRSGLTKSARSNKAAASLSPVKRERSRSNAATTITPRGGGGMPFTRSRSLQHITVNLEDGHNEKQYEDDVETYIVSECDDDGESDVDCEQLLQRVQEAIQTQQTREAEIRQGLRVHTDRAMARFDTGNTCGALVSMKRIKRLETDQRNVQSALNYLQTLELDLEMQRDSNNKTKERSSASREADAAEDADDISASMYSSLTMLDVGPIDFDAELDRILHCNMDSSATFNDEDLLSELAAMLSNNDEGGNNNKESDGSDKK